MDFQIPNFYPAIAEIFLAGMTVLVLLLTALMKRGAASMAYYLAQFAVLATGFIAFFTSGEVGFTFGNMYIDDSVGDLLKVFSSFGTALVLLYNRRYMADRNLETPEYYMLVMFVLLGICVLISAGSLITVYLGLELLSLGSYALVAIDRDSPRATEAAMKYFVLGALASGLLLYGISMVYGATGTLSIIDVARALFEGQANRTVLLFGLVFVVAGVCFKLGVVPFHMWIPDVYQGAPTSITLLVASAPKVAAFAMAFRLLAIGMWDLADQWQTMLLFVGIFSIILGNLAAIAQSNIKRMLAYSGISHMGFLLLGFACGVVDGERHFVYNAYGSAMFYSLTYLISTLAGFGILLLLSRAGFEAENIDDLKGLNRRSSWWAAMMAIVMFSMAGIPFFVGFFSKFFILQSVISAGHWWTAVVAVVFSLIGAYYYLRVVKVMFFDEPTETESIGGGWGVRTVLSLNVLGLAALGLFPGWLMQLCVVLLRNSI
ncbi:NADH-quinone oxidoreductase subunit NuoN [Uliginosibacterium sp. sgz301328]|uniref:NADH-quinone oxidoreductase subunit NuoN n=1 Tax=Uliginosibacterium sp. sgz301328 TaxID=3243764 RepID=UPI00359D6595